MALINALELFDRIRVIVHTQISVSIILTAVASIFFHDQQSSRLTTTPVTACSFACLKSLNKTVTKIALCLFKAHCHRINHPRPSQNIALNHIVFPSSSAGPRHCFETRESGNIALRINHPNLAQVTVWIAIGEYFHNIACTFP